MEGPPRDWQRDSWEWLHFAAQLPAKPVQVPALSGQNQLATGRFIYWGCDVLNGATVSHFFQVRDGYDSTAPLLSGFGVAASSYGTDRVNGGGILVTEGIFIDITGGPFNGAVYVTPLWHWAKTPPGW